MTPLTIFIVFTVLMQVGILLGILLAVRKTGAKVEAFTADATPVLASAKSILVDMEPKLREITSNMVDTSAVIKAQVQRLDATVSDLVDRTRLQALRADELVTRTMDKVEHTTELLHSGVISPVKQVAGLIQGVTAGIDVLFRKGPRRVSDIQGNVPDDEMFI